jgi:hypothetical protein
MMTNADAILEHTGVRKRSYLGWLQIFNSDAQGCMLTYILDSGLM